MVVPTPPVPLVTSPITISSLNPGDTVTFNYAAIAGFILNSIVLGSEVYTSVSDMSSLIDGTYFIDTVTSIVTIKLAAIIAPTLMVTYEETTTTGMTVLAIGQMHSINANFVKLSSSALNNYGFDDVYGEVSLSWELESPPTASISLISKLGAINPVDKLLSMVDSGITIWDIPFSIQGCSAEYRAKEKGSPYLFAKVDLVHGLFSQTNQPSVCPLDLPQIVSETSKDINLTSVTPDIINLSLGGGSYSRPNPNYNKKADTQTTCRQEIENLFKINSQFVLYDATTVKAVPVGGIGFIDFGSEAIVLSNGCEINRQGKGSSIGGVNLSREYRNTELVLDLPESNNLPGHEMFFEFENCISVSDARSPNASLGVTYRDKKSELTYPTSTFDNGGRTKTVRKIWTYNGTTIKQTEITYGLVYTSENTHTHFLEPVSPGVSIWKFNIKRPLPRLDSFWRIVEQKDTVMIFDPDDFLLGEKTTGYRTGRANMESDQLELINKKVQISQHYDLISAFDATLWAEIEDKLQKEAESYRFNSRVPIKKQTQYYLDYFKNYYKDSKRNDDKFVLRKEVIEIDSNIVVSPKDRASDPLTPHTPLIQNKEFREVELTTLIVPKDLTSAQNPERYRVTTFKYNKEGDSGGDQAIKIGQVSDRSGRPSAQIKKDSTLPIPPSLYEGKKYFLNSSGSDRFSNIVDSHGNSVHYGSFKDKDNLPVVEETLQYTGADSPSKGEAAAKIDFIRDNFKSLQVTVDVLIGSKIKPGYIVKYLGNDWMLTSLSVKGEIRQGTALFKSASCQLSFIASSVPINLTTITL